VSLFQPSRTRGPALATAGLSLLLGLLLAVVSGCGGSEVDPGTGALGSTVDPTPTAAASTPTATKTTKKPRPTKAATTADQGGDGDAEGDNEPASKGGGVCRFVGAEEVGAVLDVAVTGAAVPGVTGCKFDQGGNRGMSVTIIDKSASQAGGMSGAKAEATSAVEGTPKDLSGIGSAAFVVTGTTFGGPDVNAGGAVKLGNRIISVFLVQRKHLAEAKVRALEVDLLKLVAREGS
jgi:hypothetical protein